MENIQKGSNFIADGTTLKDNDLIKEKDVESPNLVSWLEYPSPVYILVDLYSKPQTQRSRW